MSKLTGSGKDAKPSRSKAPDVEKINPINLKEPKGRARRKGKPSRISAKTTATRVSTRKQRADTHEPTDKTRAKVTAMRAIGATLENCARAVGITRPTLEKHYAVELEFGFETVANQIAVGMIQSALAGDFKSRRLFLETHMGWGRRTRGRVDHVHSYTPLPEEAPPQVPGGAPQAALPPPGERHAGMTLGIGENTIVVREEE